LSSGVVFLPYHQRTSITDGGEAEKRPTGNPSSLFIQRLKIYSDVKKEFLQPERMLIVIWG